MGRVQLNGNAIFCITNGRLGKWDHWSRRDEQSHILGPAVFGKLPLGGQQFLRYDVGYLLAASPAAPDHTLRFRIEYEF